MEDDIKLPYVPYQLVEHLEEKFGRSQCLQKFGKLAKNNDELVGALGGIDYIINYLRS